MPKLRVIITEVREAASIESMANLPSEPKVFEQCFDDLDVKKIAMTLNKPARQRKSKTARTGGTGS
jgi:hypothetical protein